MKSSIKSLIHKLLPLVIIYFLFLLAFLKNGDVELLVVSILAIPLSVYILNDELKNKKYIKYLPHLLILGILVYWLLGSGVSWFKYGFEGISCFFKGCYGETGWNLFMQSSVFLFDLKVLLYLGVIYLAVKYKRSVI